MKKRKKTSASFNDDVMAIEKRMMNSPYIFDCRLGITVGNSQKELMLTRNERGDVIKVWRWTEGQGYFETSNRVTDRAGHEERMAKLEEEAELGREVRKMMNDKNTKGLLFQEVDQEYLDLHDKRIHKKDLNL